MTPYHEVKLSSGRTVKVYPVPPYLVALAMDNLKEPQIPKRKINPEVAIVGVNDQDLIDDTTNPEYLAKRSDWIVARSEAFLNVRLIYGLKDEFPPESWPDANTKETWEFLKISPDIPTDRLGKKLAWVKYDLLNSGADLDLIIKAIDSYAEAPQSEVDALLASFRGDGERKAD